jgi:TM2 domain-containing membrane protein YozV
MIFCNSCGAQNASNVNFCSHCGAALVGVFAQQQQPQQPQQAQQFQPPQIEIQGVVLPLGYQQKSKMVAGLLQLFVPFGIGRFYLGYTNIGIAQAIVTAVTCGVGAIWEFVDGILILMGNVKIDGNGYPLKD